MKFRKILHLMKEHLPTLAICAGGFLVVILVAVVINMRMKVLQKIEINEYNRYQSAAAKLQVKNEAYLENVMKKQFSVDQIANIIRKYYTYSISVNGSPLKKKDTIYYAQSPDVTLLLSERCSKSGSSLIPDSLVKSGSRFSKENFGNVVKISSQEKYTMDTTTVNNGSDVYLKFNKLKAGDVITLQFTHSFAETLGFSQNIFEIIYNKTGN